MDQRDYFDYDEEGLLASRPMVGDYEGIKGCNWMEALFVPDAFIATYNAMCDVTNDGAIDEFNRVFERYFPNEVGCNETLDNAYAMLSFRMNKEIADKMSKVHGMLPTGRCVYLDPEEPITIASDFTKFWCHGYVK